MFGINETDIDEVKTQIFNTALPKAGCSEATFLWSFNIKGSQISLASVPQFGETSKSWREEL